MFFPLSFSPVSEEDGLESRTFRVQLLVHIRMVLLQPILAFLRRAAKLAILIKGAWRISLTVPLAGGASDVPDPPSAQNRGEGGRDWKNYLGG